MSCNPEASVGNVLLSHASRSGHTSCPSTSNTYINIVFQNLAEIVNLIPDHPSAVEEQQTLSVI